MERTISTHLQAPSATPILGLWLLCTHVVPVPVLVALAAVAAGEGHTVEVNVQLTHWGAGRVRSLSRLPTALVPFSPTLCSA